MEGRDKARQILNIASGGAGHSAARLDVARQGEARQGKVRLGGVWRGAAGHGLARLGTVKKRLGFPSFFIS